MKVLVTGGKGYIGSITAQALRAAGHQAVSYDKKDGQDIKDTLLLKKTLASEKIEAVMHFAAYIEMGESMSHPQKYFANNFLGSQCLVETMVEAGVDKLIFSSTAGIYGNPERLPIKEDDPKTPANPYGQSKLMVEELLKFYDRTHDFRSISLRYFNAAGATLDGQLGETHQPESHLIPNVINSVMKNRAFTLNGRDYPTQDGSCVRDYIHVVDLAQAHILALAALAKGHPTGAYNVGTGRGYSNLEVIKMIGQVSSRKVKLKLGPRRPGDAAELVADPTKIKQELDFKPRSSDLKTIVRTAWNWHKNQVTI